MEKKFVAILMGSDSDLPVMDAAVEILKRFGVALEVKVTSAHRTPAETQLMFKALRRVVVRPSSQGPAWQHI